MSITPWTRSIGIAISQLIALANFTSAAPLNPGDLVVATQSSGDIAAEGFIWFKLPNTLGFVRRSQSRMLGVSRLSRIAPLQFLPCAKLPSEPLMTTFQTVPDQKNRAILAAYPRIIYNVGV
jgi:hypothetical protein